jgi:hypothetical protein
MKAKKAKPTPQRATAALDTGKRKVHPRPSDKPGVPPKTITITNEDPMTA